jgi:uncharacterized protein (TIGR03435 family)
MHRAAASLVLAMATAAFAQQPAAFEVATVRVNHDTPTLRTSNDPNIPPPPPPPALRIAPDGVVIKFATLHYCLTWAYDLRGWQINGPDWIRVVRFDITAKAATTVTQAQLKLMLQSLLAERFHMSMRRETRDAAVMALVVDKGGHKLRAAEPDPKRDVEFQFPGAGAIRVIAHSRALSSLEELLSNPGWNPVVNMTGLTGNFAFTFERPPRDPEGSWLADIQSALQKQLGLRLEPRKAPLEFLTIERADRAPSEN